MSEVTEILIQILAAVLTAATPILVAYAIKWIQGHLKKAGYEASHEELEMIRKLAEEGVAFAAQRAKVQVKTDGAPPLTSAQKKDLAMAFAKKLAKKHNVSDEVMENLDDLIESSLGKGLDG